MALPIRRSLPFLSEMTSPSAGFPTTFRTSLENTQSCPCKIRARGLTTIPAIEGIQRPTPDAQRPTPNYSVIPSGVEESLEIKSRDVSTPLDMTKQQVS